MVDQIIVLLYLYKSRWYVLFLLWASWHFQAHCKAFSSATSINVLSLDIGREASGRNSRIAFIPTGYVFLHDSTMYLWRQQSKCWVVQEKFNLLLGTRSGREPKMSTGKQNFTTLINILKTWFASFYIVGQSGNTNENSSLVCWSGLVCILVTLHGLSHPLAWIFPDSTITSIAKHRQ